MVDPFRQPQARDYRYRLSEQLAQYVLDDEHFAEFYDKVKENEQIRQEVARRQADLEKQI